MKRSNCLFFALRMFWRHSDGYLALRKSRNIVGFHWLWISADRRHIVHYEPTAPRRGLVSAAWHKLLYRGQIVWGDEER